MEQSQPQIQVDPNLAAEQQQAQQLQTQQLQVQAQGDTAALMSQYGTRLALGGSAPATSPASQPAGDPFAGTMFAGKFGAALASTVAPR